MLAEKWLHFYVLEVGLGEDRNQITCAHSHCVCFLMLAGGCQQKTNLTFLVWKVRPPECFKIPSDDKCVLPHLLLTATDFQSYNRWKLDPWSLGWESELRTCECNNCQNFIVTRDILVIAIQLSIVTGMKNLKIRETWNGPLLLPLDCIKSTESFCCPASNGAMEEMWIHFCGSLRVDWRASLMLSLI